MSEGFAERKIGPKAQRPAYLATTVLFEKTISCIFYFLSSFNFQFSITGKLFKSSKSTLIEHLELPKNLDSKRRMPCLAMTVNVKTYMDILIDYG